MSAGYTTEFVEASLVKLRNGDQQAVGQLLEKAERRLVALANRMLEGFPGVKRWESADDILQDASISLLAALSKETPNDARHFFRLAARIMRRRLIDLARQYRGPMSHAANHRTQATPRHEHVPSVAVTTHDPKKLSQWTQMHEAAEKLPPELREVFDLLFYHGQTQVAVQQALGLDPKTVRKRWIQARLAVLQAVEIDPTPSGM